MSKIFFQEFKIRTPDFNLNIGSGSHAQQVAQIMLSIEDVLLKNKPDIVIVYGDVNSTVATALVCSKIGIKVAHVEAGLRSFDLSMPEEINRIVTDRISNIFFTPSIDANLNLKNEGVDMKKVHLVGNVMIDTLIKLLPKILKSQYKVPSEIYGVATIHRPSNVDDLPKLKKIILNLNKISKKVPLVIPLHPRTRKNLQNIPGIKISENITLTDPLGYIDFMKLVVSSKFVITDSGGIQEETTFLGVPCFTLRENTERPITVQRGTNILIGSNFKKLTKEISGIINKKMSKPRINKWDGRSSDRIASIILEYLKNDTKK